MRRPHPALARHAVALWVLVFPLVGTSSGASGVLPEYVSDHDPIEIRAAALGLSCNVGALGGAAAPVLGAKLARPLGLGTAIAVLALGVTALVVLLIAFDVPRRVQSLADARHGAADVPNGDGGRPRPRSHPDPTSEKV
jgi:SHS family sialic acid transporter-like MFS transporter